MEEVAAKAEKEQKMKPYAGRTKGTKLVEAYCANAAAIYREKASWWERKRLSTTFTSL
ncbi:hypothetical protein MMC18_004026 [Xylographa bjoerkii]|nr:hypothetical protein [Xylographa bjoerkii]